MVPENFSGYCVRFCQRQESSRFWVWGCTGSLPHSPADVSTHHGGGAFSLCLHSPAGTNEWMIFTLLRHLALWTVNCSCLATLYPAQQGGKGLAQAKKYQCHCQIPPDPSTSGGTGRAHSSVTVKWGILVRRRRRRICRSKHTSLEPHSLLAN